MNNPYKPPDSNIVSTEDSSRYYPPIGWKFYFWFSVFMLLLSIILFIVSSVYKLELFSFNLFDLLDFIIWTISLFPIFGLAWSHKFLTQRLWRIFMLVFVLWFILYSLIAAFIFEIPQYGSMLSVTDLLYGIPFFLLTLWGIHRYTSNMDYLWKIKKTPSETGF